MGVIAKKPLYGFVVVVLVIVAYRIVTNISDKFSINLFRQEWLGFYYPNGCFTCGDHIISQPFNKKADCLVWGNNLKFTRRNLADQFECGLNCKKTEYGLYTCKETVDY